MDKKQEPDYLEELLLELKIRFDNDPKYYTKRDYRVLIEILTYFIESDWPIPEKFQKELDDLVIAVAELSDFATDEEIDLIFEEEQEESEES